MKQLYWNVDPEEVVKQNIYLKNIDIDARIRKIILILCQEYKNISNEILNVIGAINGRNFEEMLSKVFDKEAYLAEIYFYLSGDILINFTDIDVLESIKNDYLLNYYWKIEEMNQTENVVFFLRKWLDDKCNDLNNSHI